MEATKTYTGIDLLEKILEFIAMTPDRQQWNSRALSYNEPRLIRLQQIHALLKAFSLIEKRSLVQRTAGYFHLDLQSEISSVLNGDFIDDRPLEDFQKVIEFAREYLQKGNNYIDRPVRLTELRFIYPKMINYKIKLRELIDFNSGWMEAGGTFALFHIVLTGSISANLHNNYGDLDHVLELFLNPGKLRFTEKELIEKFGFPTDDLHQIDMENY